MKTCEGIFANYMKIYFQVKFNAYVQYASIDAYSPYEVGHVSKFVTFFAKPCVRDGVKRQLRVGNIHLCDK